MSCEPGTTISATTLGAPGKTQESFKRGCEEASKGKWKAAADHFRGAVRIYSNYAIAWVYPVKVELHQTHVDEARVSFQEA